MIGGLIVDSIHIVNMGFSFGLQVNIPLTIVLRIRIICSLCLKHVGVHPGYSCHFDEERHFKRNVKNDLFEKNQRTEENRDGPSIRLGPAL